MRKLMLGVVAGAAALAATTSASRGISCVSRSIASLSAINPSSESIDSSPMLDSVTC